MTTSPDFDFQPQATRPSKHGMILDFTHPDGRRVHLRCFTFAPGMVEGVATELPALLREEELGEMLGLGAGICGGKAESTNEAPALASAATTAAPVIFLDVDGVLNTRPGSLDADKLDMLCDLVKEMDARLVLSSSWRLVKEQRLRLLVEVDLRDIPFIGVTPDLSGRVEGSDLWGADARWREIEQWRNDARCKGPFVILDDLTDMGPYSLEHVQVDAAVGLTKRDVSRALEILSEQMKEGRAGV